MRKEIADYLGSWLAIATRFWNDAKIKYINACKTNSKTQAELDAYKGQFKLLAKLHYCADMISNYDCVAAMDLQVLNSLMSLQHRVEGLMYGQNHEYSKDTSKFTSKEYRFQELQQKPIYKYLYHASKEILGVEDQAQYNEIFDIPLNILADELFNRMIELQYKYDKTVICPVWEPYDNGKYVRDWDYRFVRNNNISNSTAALELAESYFKDWLDIDLREQELGKSLSY